MINTRTKIVCTIGPASNNYETITELIKTGMNVARLNFSHGDYERHAETIDRLKKARTALNVPLAIMLDTKGPEIRVGSLPEEFLHLRAGEKYYLGEKYKDGDHQTIPITPHSVIKDLVVGENVLFDDGYLSSIVLEVNDNQALIEIDHGGKLKGGKGVNVPGANLDLPSLTEKDIADIEFACDQDLDFIAASFIRTAEDILNIRKLIDKKEKNDILIFAKIENNLGIQNFDGIVHVSDGVMIARGDLGVEVPLSQVPRLQKMMIRKSILAGKPTITATQMLESMTYNPRPTRAEVSDVANAIYDSTSMVMLSGETAVGKYPVRTVEVMKKIVYQAEDDCDYQARFAQVLNTRFHDTPSAIALSTVNTAYSTLAKAIFILSSTGRTARLISRLRPEMPLVVLTNSEKVYHQLVAHWGVTPVLSNGEDNLEKAYDFLSTTTLKLGIVRLGDLVTVTAGSPFGVSGTTNMMMVKSIGDVLIRGFEGYGTTIHGRVLIIHSPEEINPFEVKGRIIVITRCDDSYLALIKEASGVILQNHVDDIESERYALVLAKALEIPTLVRADLAASMVRNEQLITLRPEQALVYNGIIK